MGCYARFVTNYPWAVILVDIIVVFICGPIGIWQAGVPDFSNPNKGYEPRGTAIRGRDLANTRLVSNILNENFTRIPNNSPGAPQSSEPGSVPRVRRATYIEGCMQEVIQNVTVRALPPALRATQNLPESTALPRMVVQPKTEGDSLWTAEYMKAICELENKYISSVLKTTCNAFTLPYYIGALQNKTCSQLIKSDMDTTLNLLKECASYYFNGNITVSCSNDSCSNVPMKCLRYNAVFNIFHYFSDVDFFKDGNTEKTKLSYSQIIFRRSWDINVEKLYDYFMENLESTNVENNLVEVKGYDMDLIVGDVNKYYVLTDLPFYGLAMALVIVVLFLYLRSFALMATVMLNVGLTLAVSYFIYHVVCRFIYFGFTNLLAGLLLIAIGADDVFIFFDIWHKIKHEAPNPDIVNIEDVTSHTIRHAFLSILVTSLTTAAALFANAISDVIALRCFGIFGGICIIVNLFFMVTLVPSILVILEKIIRKYPSCCGCAWADKFTKPLNKLSRYIWGEIIPVIVIKGSVFWLLVFLGFGIYGFIAVFYKPQLRLPSTEKFQIFYSDHPLEVYKFRLRDKFRFEIENEEKNKVKINLNFVFGIDGKDNGNIFDPDDTGILKLDESFNMFTANNQLWIKQFCSNLIIDGLVLDSSQYKCFMDVYKTVVTSACSYPDYNVTLQRPCCMSKFPLPTSDANTCLMQNDFVKLIHSLKDNKTIIGAPIYDISDNKLIAVSFQVKTSQFWTPVYSEMNAFYNHFEDFMKDELSTAPIGLDGGWFSGAYGRELYFFDLQAVMVKGVISGIALSMGVAFLIMLITSGNFFITLYAIITIVIVIAVTVGILVLLGWELGVSEALVITLTVGLSIDFTIHLGVAYKVSPSESREKKVKDAIETVGFAVTMAALTTFLSGTALMGGRVQSYYRFGVFLMLDMVVSWLFALFFFMPLCKFIGPVGSFGDLSALFRKCTSSSERENMNQKTVFKEDKTKRTPITQMNGLANKRNNIYIYDVKHNGIDRLDSSYTENTYVNHGYVIDNGTPRFVDKSGNKGEFGFTVFGSSGNLTGSFKGTYTLPDR